MIKNERKYVEWIEKNEGISKHEMASAIKSLKSISILIGEDLSEKNLFNDNCIEIISKKLRGLKNEKSISNYKVVLRHYVNMVENLRATTSANTK
ncbi:MAG: hypothetical protein COB01_11250 [Lutibacter sp.]|nr:MAG: hypothetical protein COB01_11250 [Lutibacter sp.]